MLGKLAQRGCVAPSAISAAPNGEDAGSGLNREPEAVAGSVAEETGIGLEQSEPEPTALLSRGSGRPTDGAAATSRASNPKAAFEFTDGD